MISQTLMQTIKKQFLVEPDGIHGVAHWARVLEIGRRLAPQTGARLDVVELFAVLHDSRRLDNGYDAAHGPRGAEYAAQLRGDLFELDDAGFALLIEAIRDHTCGKIDGNVTVRTCWDCDRLDLARAGIMPRPERLCTTAARNAEMLSWSNQRALAHYVPVAVLDEWGL